MLNALQASQSSHWLLFSCEMWEQIAKCLPFELRFLEIHVFSTGDWEPEFSTSIWMHISWVLH